MQTMKKLVRTFLIAAIIASCLACTQRKEEKNRAGAEINDPAYSFALADVDGKQVSLDGFKGKVIMLEFFTPWCLPCQMAAPEVQALFEKYKDKGFVVLGISLKEGSDVSSVKAFVKDYHLSYPALLDDGSISKKYGVFSIPTSFLIDRQGKIRSKHIGLIPDLTSTLSKEVEALL